MPIALPMFGARRARVLGAQSVSLHGDVYHDLLVTLHAPGSHSPAPGTGEPIRLRVASHLCARPPEPGDELELSFLMQQVNGVKLA